MSSLKNAQPNRTHQERPQPHSRSSRHPLLEKRKDYRLRARDHKAKQAKLKALQEKARWRNEDEFSFGMMSAGKSEGGRMVKQRGKDGDEDALGMSVAKVRGLKAQDTAWLRNELGRVRGMIQDVKGQLRIPSSSVGTGFAEVENDSDDGTEKETAGALGCGKLEGSNRQKRRKTLFIDALPDGGAAALHELVKSSARHREIKSEPPLSNREILGTTVQRRMRLERRENFLGRLRDRETTLMAEEREVGVQRARMGKSAVGVDGVNKNGVRFRVRRRAP